MSKVTAKIIESLVEQCQALADESRGLLGSNPINTALLESKVRQCQGLFQMLEIGSGARLASELLQTLGSLKTTPETINENAEQLQGLMDLFPRLLRQAGSLQVDTACVFQPEISKLRALLGKPPAYEYQLLPEYNWPSVGVQSQTPDLPGGNPEVLKRLRHLYQLGLLDVVQGRNRAKALTLMSRVAERLKQLLTPGDTACYWSLVEKVTAALATGELKLRADRVRLLSAVERQLKALATPDQGGKSPYPAGLWAVFGALLALTRVASEEDRELRQWLMLPDLSFTDTDLLATRALVLEDEQADDSELVAGLRTHLGTLQSLLGLIDNEPAFSAEDLQQFRQTLAEIATGCREIGLTTSCERFEQHLQALPEVRGESSPVSVELLKQISESVLYLECLLLDFHGDRSLSAEELKQINLREVDQVIETNLMKSGVNAVWTECLSQLTSAKEYLDDINGGLSGSETVPELASVFDRIRSTAIVIGDTRVVDVAWRCSDFVRDGLLTRDPVMPRETRLATFADAIIGLEYHLENCVNGEAGDERPLTVADEYLASLGA